MKTSIFFLALVAGFILTIFVTRNLSTRSTKPVKIVPTNSPTVYEPKPLEFTGWVAYWDEKSSFKDLPLALPLFDTFSPMLYAVGRGGTLRKLSVATREQMLMLARNRKLPIIPTIGDESNPERVAQLLSDNATAQNFTQSLIDEAATENYQGWSLDIESLRGKDEESFSNFISELADALHTQNLELHVIVFGKEENEAFDPGKAHNYIEIGNAADRVILMTYNYHNELTDPGGQTPLDWYRRALSYAVATIPLNKIAVGLSTHGYEWYDGATIGLTYKDVIKRLSQIQSPPEYNNRHSSKVLKFEENGETHELWYEDAQTIVEKIKIARDEFGIYNFALWRLGAEDPTIWEELKRL